MNEIDAAALLGICRYLRHSGHVYVSPPIFQTNISEASMEWLINAYATTFGTPDRRDGVIALDINLVKALLLPLVEV